jgi:cell division protein FtsW
VIQARKQYDRVLFVLTVVITFVGMFFIFDSGYARSLAGGDGVIPQELRSQVMFFPLALLAYWACSRLPSAWWQKWSKALWYLCFLSLLAVHFYGKEMNGAQRWLELGPFTVQPAEFAKLLAVTYLAGVFADRKPWPTAKRKFSNRLMWLDNVLIPKAERYWAGIFVLIAFVLIEREPDLGTGAVVAATAYAMFFPGGVSRKSLTLAMVLAVGAVIGMVLQEPYRLERVTNHGSRWEVRNVDDIGWQTVNSEMAMADGGILGVGVGGGRAKHVLPATTTDFVMATVAEEFGVVGALGLLGLLGALVWRILWLAQRAANRFAMLTLYGVGVWIGLQTCVNVMMANGFLMPIGLPLPFISSGGSSLIALWMAIGVCQSVAHPEPAKEEAAETSRHRRGHRRAYLPGFGGRSSRRGTRRQPAVPRVPAGSRR